MDMRRKKGKQGFASMSPEKVRELASKGGVEAHKKGTAHKFTSETAKEAGKKGGRIAHQLGRAHQWTSETAREATKKRHYRPVK